jgi:hypothetical protein
MSKIVEALLPLAGPLLRAGGKLLGDLFGNKTRTGLTSAGLAIITVLTALGTKPEVAEAWGAVGECVIHEAAEYYKAQGVQDDDGGAGDESAGVFESRGHGAGSATHDGGPGALGVYGRTYGAIEQPPASAGKPVAASVNSGGYRRSWHGPKGDGIARRWPWVGPPPLPA